MDKTKEIECIRKAIVTDEALNKWDIGTALNYIETLLSHIDQQEMQYELLQSWHEQAESVIVSLRDEITHLNRQLEARAEVGAMLVKAEAELEMLRDINSDLRAQLAGFRSVMPLKGE